MQKKGLALILSFAMVLSIVPMTAFGQDFTDMPTNWSRPAVEKALENGLLKGDKGKVRPEENLTRAEMATVVNRAFKAVDKAPLTKFTDIGQSDWYYEEMAKAVQMETFVGSGDKLNPQANITRQEAFVVLARAFKISEKDQTVLNAFSDKDHISTWAKEDLAGLVKAGYVAGANSKINPKANITRAEFAQIMDNLVKTYISEKGTYTEDLAGNVMVNQPGVVLKGITITGDLIVGDGVGKGDLILEDTIIRGRMVVRGGGEDSIIIRGTSNVKSITIAKVDGKVRVYNQDGAEIGEVILDGKDDVILEGKFESVTIEASNTTLVARGADIKAITVTGETAKISADKNSTLDKVTVNAKDAKIEGEGKVKEVAANANNTSVETKGTKVEVAEDTTGTTVGGKEVKAGETTTAPVQEAPRVGGSSSSSTVAVTGVSVNKTEMRLVAGGGTGTLEATVSPANATNNTVTWISSNNTVATVADGVVTPVAAGTATITARAGGKTVEVTVTVYDAENVITTPTELKAALLAAEVTDITVDGVLGSDTEHTIYNVNRTVTIKGVDGAKVYGSFIIKADGVTIDNLEIQNKGDLTGESSTNRGGIYVFANNVTLTNNTITNGLGSNPGLSNAIQIMSPTADNPLSNYVITDNKLIGHDNEVTNWASSGIVITQGYTPGSIGEAVLAITATAEDYANLLEKNTFTNNKIDLTHQDWSKTGDDIVLYPKIVTTAAELTAALANEAVTDITVDGVLGSDTEYTIYNVGRAVTIKGADENAKLYGTFRVNKDDITIKDLAIENKGDPTGSTQNRSAIYIIAKNVTLKNNTIINGLGTGGGLSNAITIRSASGPSSLSSYDITGNTITGHDQGVDKWSSTGLVIIENWSVATGEKITANLADYQKKLTDNRFTSNDINLDHTDYGHAADTEKTVLFRSPLNYVEGLKNKITEAEAKVKANYTDNTWSTLQTALTAAKEVEANIATAEGTYQATIINANDKLKAALDGLVGK